MNVKVNKFLDSRSILIMDAESLAVVSMAVLCIIFIGWMVTHIVYDDEVQIAIDNAETSYDECVIIEIKHYTEPLDYPLDGVKTELITGSGQVIGTTHDDFKIGEKYMMYIYKGYYRGRSLSWFENYELISDNDGNDTSQLYVDDDTEYYICVGGGRSSSDRYGDDGFLRQRYGGTSESL